MNNLGNAGRLIFAAAIAAFGVQHFLYASAGKGLGPPWILGRPIWLCLMGATLLLASASFVTKKQSSLVATLLGAILFFYAVILYFPGLITHLHDPGPWTSSSEILALGGAAWVLACTRSDRSPSNSTIAAAGRILFALTLVVFAIQHFLYANFIATLIPPWIPARLFWAYFVGVAFAATAASIVTKIQARLGTTLLGIMFLLWVIILHIPRVVAASHNSNEWTSLLVALAMSGASWILAGSM
jgi:uncharacterized membrane protein